MEVVRRPRVCGIYAIAHVASGRRYIGSSNDAYRRWHDHQQGLRRGNHPNKFLQSMWNKYGEQAFEFVILRECPPNQLRLIEQRMLNSPVKLLNICQDATRPPPQFGNQNGKGRAPTPEHLAKMVAGNIASWTLERCARISAAKKGKPKSNSYIPTDEDRAKGQVALRAWRESLTEEEVAERSRAQSDRLRDRPWTDAQKVNTLAGLRRAAAEGKMSREISTEQRADVSALFKGKPWSAARRAAYEKRFASA